MDENIVFRTDSETRRKVEILAKSNPFSGGNISAYLRGLINQEWEKLNKKEMVNAEETCTK